MWAPLDMLTATGYLLLMMTGKVLFSVQCPVCLKYQRNILNSSLTKFTTHQSISPGRSKGESHTNYRYCNTPEKCARLVGLHETVRLQKRALQHLENQLHRHIQSSGVTVDNTIQSDLLKIMHNHSDAIAQKYGKDSFQAMFWQQQIKSSSAIGSSGRRWHPLIIKWCLYLRHMSSKAYETVCNSGIITLPSSRTLQDYKHISSTTVGFSIEADRQLLDILNIKDDKAKYGILLFDEMYIKQGLVFEKSTGALFGFTDLGEINNQIDEFQHAVTDGGESLHQPIAKAMLVFMFKGLFNNVSLPYAQFPVCSVKGGDIFPLFWQTVGRLQRIGYVILGATCDGCSSNRLFSLHRNSKNELVHKAVNVFDKKHNTILFL